MVTDNMEVTESQRKEEIVRTKTKTNSTGDGGIGDLVEGDTSDLLETKSVTIVVHTDISGVIQSS